MRRVELGMTQLEFAARAGISSRAQVQKIEHNRLQLTKLSRIRNVAQVLKFCPKELAATLIEQAP